MSDNFLFDVTGGGGKNFDIIFAYAWQVRAGGGKTKYYAITEKHGMIFYWTAPNASDTDARPLPYEMGMEAALDFTKGWLNSVEYPPEPDHDGHNEKGWRIFNEQWGHVAGQWQAFIAIKPEWQMFGK